MGSERWQVSLRARRGGKGLPWRAGLCCSTYQFLAVYGGQQHAPLSLKQIPGVASKTTARVTTILQYLSVFQISRSAAPCSCAQHNNLASTWSWQAWDPVIFVAVPSLKAAAPDLSAHTWYLRLTQVFPHKGRLPEGVDEGQKRGTSEMWIEYGRPSWQQSSSVPRGSTWAWMLPAGAKMSVCLRRESYFSPPFSHISPPTDLICVIFIRIV